MVSDIGLKEFGKFGSLPGLGIGIMCAFSTGLERDGLSINNCKSLLVFVFRNLEDVCKIHRVYDLLLVKSFCWDSEHFKILLN